MENKKYSERERLFKLIRGDAGALKELQKRKSLKITSKKLKSFLFLARQNLKESFRRLIKGELSFRKPSSCAQGLGKLNLASINKILIGILAIMIIYLVSDFIGAILLKKFRVTLSTAKYAEQKRSPLTKLSPLSYYLEQVGGKELFNPKRIELIEAKAGVSPEEPVAGLKLVGVDWGGNPVALIEDTKTQKTYFVKKGDSIEELKVMEIFRDRVKLRYDNKVIELK